MIARIALLRFSAAARGRRPALPGNPNAYWSPPLQGIYESGLVRFAKMA
jgi:hypothetical protein